LVPFVAQSKLVFLFKELDAFSFISINLEMNSLEDTFVHIGMDE
jgi:hypothetical protein